MITPPFPDVPYPYPPERSVPERRDPLMVPIVYEPAGRDPISRLYERRTVLLSGTLDSAVSTRVAAELMSLDGHSARPIELMVNSTGGPIADVFAVLDVMTLLRGRIATTCFGRAFGTAAVVLASGTGPRRATANATVCLRCPDAHTSGMTRGVEQRAEQQRRERDRLSEQIRAVTGLPLERVERELTHGALMDVSEALQSGIIDEVAEGLQR